MKSDSFADRRQNSPSRRAHPGRAQPVQPRAAVAGLGFIGVTHIETLRRLGVEVTGVVDASPARAVERARTIGVEHAYASFEAMLSDPDVDVVHLATPNRHHYRQALAAIDAGKHVVCEKPLALESSESGDLVRRANAAGLVNAVCFNSRFYPLCRQAREMIADGAIGAPRLITGGYLQDWLLFPSDWSWRLVASEGGDLQSVGDIGSHWLDLARFVTGRRIDSVVADLHTFVPVRLRPVEPTETFSSEARSPAQVEVPMNGDDAAGVLLRFEGGARGVLMLSQVSAGNRNAIRLEVDGVERSVSWSSERSEELWIGHRDRPNEILVRDPALLGAPARGITAYPGGHVEGFPDTFRALFAGIYRDVEAGGPSSDSVYATFADGHEGLLVGEAIAQSARQQRWITVDRDSAG